MNRKELSTTESVADLFRVSIAKSRRRMIRLQDNLDWVLFADLLEASFGLDKGHWLEDPIEAVVCGALTRTRSRRDAQKIAAKLASISGGWNSLVRGESSTNAFRKRFGLTTVEAGHIQALLSLIAGRYGDVKLAALATMGDVRAQKELLALPGIDAGTAGTVLVCAFGRRILPPTTEVRRVLTRMGVVDANAIPDGKLLLSGSIPPDAPMKTLLQGTQALAESHCAEQAPSCGGCPVQKLCETGRQRMTDALPSRGLSFVDLFCGAGGMSLGLTQAGLVPALGLDSDEWACRTYRLNHPQLPPDRVVCRNIEELDPSEIRQAFRLSQPDVVVGGPPCQGFSLIGKRGRSRTRFTEDPRNQRYNDFVKWVRALGPRFVVMENVPGLFSYADGLVREDIEESLSEAGYAVADVVVDTANFGIPQRRQRVLFVGAARTAFGARAEDVAARVVELLAGRKDPTVSLGQAIRDLPYLQPGEGREASARPPARSVSRYAVKMGARNIPMLFHHLSRPINLRDRLLYARIAPGETASDILAQSGRHVMVYRNDVFEDKYRRLVMDEPSPTIMSHLSKDGHMFIHPDTNQHRSITVREAARIQSFPDDFIFCGPRTHQFTQVGNAVPPLMGQAIGEAILKALEEIQA